MGEIESFNKKLDKLDNHKKDLHDQKNKAHAALTKHLEKQGEKLADHVAHLDNKLKDIKASIKETKDALAASEKQFKELGCKGTADDTTECKKLKEKIDGHKAKLKDLHEKKAKVEEKRAAAKKALHTRIAATKAALKATQDKYEKAGCKSETKES